MKNITIEMITTSKSSLRRVVDLHEYSEWLRNLMLEYKNNLVICPDNNCTRIVAGSALTRTIIEYRVYMR